MKLKKIIFVALSIVIMGTGVWFSWSELFGQTLPLYNTGLRWGHEACGEVVLRSEDRAVRNARFTTAYMSYTQSIDNGPVTQQREDMFTYQGASYDALYCNDAFLSYSRKYYYSVPEANVRACINTVHFDWASRLTSDLATCKSMKNADGAKLLGVQTSWLPLLINLAVYLLLPAGVLTYVWLKYLRD